MKLPKIPSQLIRLALDDLAKVEANPKYSVDMSHWLTKAQGHCTVCFAGAVMVGSLADSDTVKDIFSKRLPKHHWMLSFDPDTREALFALDDFRGGYCGLAFDYLGLSAVEGSRFERDVTTYAHSPKKFRKDMRKLADDLEAAGY